MYKYRKRPVVIEVIRWSGENLLEVLKFADSIYIDTDNYTLKIETLEGTMVADRGND